MSGIIVNPNALRDDPSGGTEQVAVPKYIWDNIKALVAYAFENASKGRTISTDTDWKIMKSLLRMWEVAYPEEAMEFYTNNDRLRHDYKGRGGTEGYSKKSQGMLGQHKFEMPQRLYQMILVIFPMQNFTQDFVDEFIIRFPAFDISGKFKGKVF